VFSLPGLVGGRCCRARLFGGAVSEVSTGGLSVTASAKFQSELCVVEAE
jgi:hypothetical protein